MFHPPRDCPLSTPRGRSYVCVLWLFATSGLIEFFPSHFSDEEKKDKWARVVAPVGAERVVEKREASGPAPVHSPLTLFASLISPTTTLSHTLPSTAESADTPHKVFVHVAQTSGFNLGRANGAEITVSAPDGSSVVMREGDGMYILGDAGVTLRLQNTGDRVAEVLLFDVE